MLVNVEFTNERQLDGGNMSPEEIVVRIRDGKVKKSESSANGSRPFAAALDSLKSLFRRTDKPPVYRAHTVMDTALDLTPDTKDAVARLY